MNLPWRNVRFWAWHGDGWVKLKLRPGQEINAYRRQITDEGWSEEAETWRLEGGIVYYEWSIGGRDCDGRSYQTGVCQCPAGELHPEPFHEQEAYFNGKRITAPMWRKVSAEQYDENAELAGF